MSHFLRHHRVSQLKDPKTNAEVKNGEIKYSDCVFLGLKHAIDESEIYKFDSFKEGDNIKVTKKKILVFKKDKLLHSIKREDESFGFPLKFY